MAELAKAVVGSGWKSWAEARYRELDQGKVEILLGAILRLKSAQPDLQAAIEKAIHYFQINADRMRYARFRRQGLFVGSGVVEAGCKMIVGQRLKQSGMRWTVRARSQRHYRLALLGPEQPMGRLLGISESQLRGPTHKFVAHPLDSLSSTSVSHSANIGL